MASNWYIVHAYSNFEKKVAESIMTSAKDKKLFNKLIEVFVLCGCHNRLRDLFFKVRICVDDVPVARHDGVPFSNF